MSETKNKTQKTTKMATTTKPQAKAKPVATKPKAKVTKPKAAVKVATVAPTPMVSNAGLLASMREALTTL